MGKNLSLSYGIHIPLTNDEHLNNLIMECVAIEEEIDDVLDSDDDNDGRGKHRRTCGSYIHRQRLLWYPHMRKCVLDGTWQSKYRMSVKAFSKLVTILRPLLQRNSNKCRRGRPIIPEIVVACGVRYLGGEQFRSFTDIYNISATESKWCVKDFLSAVHVSDELKIRLPYNPEGWEKVRLGFASKSRERLFSGCCGAIDGFFQAIEKPSITECTNPAAYRSGHYKMFGLNCQAACSADLKFIYFGIVAPGKTSDSVALDAAKALKEAINNLPLGCFFVGDAAYIISDRMLIPFVGPHRSNVDNDAFNFYLSQVHICIEMVFGLLTTKWRILRKKLDCQLKNNSRIILCCAMLHNYVLEEDTMRESGGNNTPVVGASDFIITHAPSGMQYLPNIPESYIEIPGVSEVRNAILEVIHEKQMRRPLHNTLRNDVGNGESNTGVPIEVYNPY